MLVVATLALFIVCYNRRDSAVARSAKSSNRGSTWFVKMCENGPYKIWTCAGSVFWHSETQHCTVQ